MGRLINTNSTGSQRQRWRRTIAEALKRLMQKGELDEEVQDLAALIVLSLREISAGVERSATAWDKRHYYIKADRLRADWEWADRMADRMANLIVAGDWMRLPVVLARLAPRFADVGVSQLTRSAELWNGAHKRLIEDEKKRRATAKDAGAGAGAGSGAGSRAGSGSGNGDVRT